MKNFLKKIFGQKPENKIVEFTKIIHSRQNLVICASDNIFVNYQLLCRLVSWSEVFEKIELYFTESEANFWRKVDLPVNLEIKVIADLSELEEQFIINFSTDKEVNIHLEKKTASVIADIDNRYNLQFDPFLENEISLILKLEKFFPGEDFKDTELVMRELPEARSDAFILDIANTLSNKKCLILIDNLKKDFDPDIQLIGPEFDTAELVSLMKIPQPNIAEKFPIAYAGKIFITDHAQTALLFDKFNLQLIYVGKEKIADVITIDPLDNFEMKNSIADLIKRR